MSRIIIFSILFLAFVIYSYFVYTKGSTANAIVMNAEATNGKLLFQKYNCSACHQVYGLGGYLGPELTTVISQHGKGEAYAKAFLKSGSQRMPDFHLSDQEIKDLLEFLKYMDATAVSNYN